MKIKNIFFILIFFLISLTYVLGSSEQALLNQTLFLFFPIFTTLAGAIAVSIYGLKSITGKSMLTLTLGFACWAIGEIVWYVSKNILGVEPFPSVADIFFLLGYPLVFAGLYVEFDKARVRLDTMKRSSLFLSGLLALALAGIVSYFGIYLAYDPGVGFLENAVAMSYGIADLVLIVGSLFALAMVDTYRGGKFSSFWMSIILVSFLFLAADILFSIFSEPYTENLKPYTYIDLLWIAGYLLLAHGMLTNYYHIHDIRRKIKTAEN